MTQFSADIELSQRYRDVDTNFEGVATAVSFYEEGCGCPRAQLKALVDKKVVYEWFDLPKLKLIPADAPVGFSNGKAG
jgi:hypothetical protein